MSATRNGTGGRCRALAPAVVACVVLHALAPASVRRDSTYLADLTAEESEALAASARDQPLPDDPRALLGRIFDLLPAYRFDVGLVIVDTDRRWFRVAPTGAAAGEPILELRRWPGDTVLLLYVLRGAATSDASGSAPPVPRATFDRPEEVSEGRRRWVGTLEDDSGSRTVGWEERTVPGTDHRLGALMVPGDAGLGPQAVDELYIEISVVLDRALIVPDAWTSADGVAVTGKVVVPPLGFAPEESDEDTDTWQIMRTRNFTIGLPPGVRSKRTSAAVPGPVPVPDGVVWLRGRFTNSDGDSVILGDPRHGGYVAEIHDVDEAWLTGATPPRGAPGASLRAGAPFDLAADRSAARSARAERWADPGLEGGEWLLFRLQLEEGGVEIGLPVLAGRQSEALFWIPLTWRSAAEPPAPPPIDPAKRFGIRFERLTPAARKHNPWIEGYLEVPGLRLELPVGWWPIANLRADDGFPIQLLDGETRPVAELTRIVLREIDLSQGSGWEAIKRVRRYHASQAFAHADGQRIYVSPDGQQAFLLSPDAETPPAPEVWERVVESALLSG